MNENTVVLLHGSGVGAWIWDRVISLIPTTSIALEVPSRSTHATPASCASSILEAIDKQGISKVILVMHSLAGVLAAELAGQLGDRLVACVYVSAVIPAAGSTFAKAIGFPGRFLLPILFRKHPDGLWIGYTKLDS